MIHVSFFYIQIKLKKKIENKIENFKTFENIIDNEAFAPKDIMLPKCVEICFYHY